jgi:hypothetical protein
MTSAKPLSILVNSYTGFLIHLRLVSNCAAVQGWDNNADRITNQCLETEQLLTNTLWDTLAPETLS